MRAQSKLTLVVVALAALSSACKDTIVKVIEVVSVNVTAASSTIVLSGTTQLTASPRDDKNNVLGNRPVTWSSTNTSVATVDNAGLVRGVGAGSATIQARVEGVTGTADIAVNNPVPSITTLTPSTLTAGQTGTDLTVNGSGFIAGSVVLWNGQTRPTQFVNATTLRATLEAADISATGRVNVSVRNPQPGGGTSSANDLDIVNPQPAVTSLSPAFVMVGGASFELTVTGTGFVPNSVIRWNQSARTTQYINATTLRTTITAADAGSAVVINVTVTNPQPGGGVSSVRPFEVRNPTPVLTAVTPNTVLFGGASFELTVTGAGFVPGSVVRWNGQPRQTTVVNGTSARATIPPSDIATPGRIEVTVDNPTPGGGASSSQPFIARIISPARSLDAGSMHSCAVRANGDAYCWGLNDSGQLGDGTTTDRVIPTRVQATVPFLSVVAGSSHGCGLTSWGAAYCWGLGSTLGRANTTRSTTPVAVEGDHAFVQLAAGDFHTCGVTAAQALYCWGTNFAGQLGDNTTAFRSTPVAVGTPTQRWRLVIAGDNHTCALTTTAQLYCWGDNGNGQLGDGTVVDRHAPVLAAAGASYMSVAAGALHTCALTGAGLAFCWGWGGQGQLGHGAFTSSPTPVAVSGGAIYNTLSSSENHTCGTTQAGLAFCWGSGFDAQLGDGRLSASATPVSVVVPPVREIAPGELHTCALGNNNAVYCWGARNFGALGDGVAAVRPSPATVTGGTTGYTAVSVGVEFSCGLLSGAARCWGTNATYQLGDNSTTDRLVPSPVSSTQSFTAIDNGLNHSCALTAAGAVYCWGIGSSGQLGNGSTATAVAPTQIASSDVFRDISVGSFHACGVTAAGVVRCWGANFDGQLGDGTITQRMVPTAITGPAGVAFSTVTAGDRHTCAVSTAGALYCWGNNLYGRVGDGTTEFRNAPARIDVGAAVQRVSAGVFHTCAVTTAGAAYCWGFPGAGELGHGSSSGTQQTTPVAVSGSRTFRTISAGRQATCGTTTTNEAFCWGLNNRGQLGTGDLVWPNAPAALAGGGAYSDVQTRNMHSCGLTTTGAVRCWGHSRFGELGIDLVGYVTNPTAVQGGLTFGAVCSSEDCTVALARESNRGFSLSVGAFGTTGAGIRHSAPGQRAEPIEPPLACAPGEPCRPIPMRPVRR
jgi:alpha-tubulin suppressor-like RCC1 family protein